VVGGTVICVFSVWEWLYLYGVVTSGYLLYIWCKAVVIQLGGTHWVGTGVSSQFLRGDCFRDWYSCLFLVYWRVVHGKAALWWSGGWSGVGLYSWAVGGGVGCCICRMVSEILVGYILLISLRWFCDAASLWIGIYRHTKHKEINFWSGGTHR
jgi:hypothetical protein